MARRRVRQEYDRLVAEWLACGRTDIAADNAPSITISEVLLAFWQFAQGWYIKNEEPTNEIEAYRLILRDVRELYGATVAADFGPLAFKAVRQRWIDRGQARSTVNKNAGRLKRLFKWAVSEELVPATVHHALSTVEGLRKGRTAVRESKRILPVALDVVEATILHLPPVTADMIRVQLLTGARPGEVCKMRPCDIDRSADVWEYRVGGHKTEHHGRERTVYIGPEAQAVLTAYLLRDSQTVCFSMAESVEQRRQAKHELRTTPANCGNSRGRRSKSDREGNAKKRRPKPRNEFDANSYRKAIHYACDEAFPAPAPLGKRVGESDAARRRRLSESQSAELNTWQASHRWAPNQLRHTRGTDIRKRFGLEAAQVILGHADAGVTQVYAERDREKAIEVARQVG